MPISGFTEERITANCGIVYLHVDKERGSRFAAQSVYPLSGLSLRLALQSRLPASAVGLMVSL